MDFTYPPPSGWLLKMSHVIQRSATPFRDSVDELFPVLFQKSRERSSRPSQHLPLFQMEVIHSSQCVHGERMPATVIQMTLVISFMAEGFGRGSCADHESNPGFKC